jgi:hypothetical protein
MHLGGLCFRPARGAELTVAGPEARLSQGQVSLSLDEDDDDEPAFLSLPPPDAQSSWYPSLRVTLWVLSCLYSYVDVSRTSPSDHRIPRDPA